MNDVPLKCLVGLTSCEYDSLRIVGSYVSWFGMLSLAGIIFAISQFTESNRLRTYILRRKKVTWLFYGLIVSAILAVVIANLLAIPIIPAEPIPLISYPAFWELLSLVIFSFLMLGSTLLSMNPLLFIPRFNRRNHRDFWGIAVEAVLYDGSNEAISALCKILYKNLGTIVSYALMFDRYWKVQGSTYTSPYEKKGVKKKDEEVVNCAVQLVDELLSHDVFCKFIAQKHLKFIMRSIDLAEKHKLWHSCGYFFFSNMFKWLFEDQESLLSQELKRSGLGYSQPLSNHTFKAFGMIENYRIFQSFGFSEINNTDNVDAKIVKKICHGLELALKEYFKEPQPACGDTTPSTALGVAINDLAEKVSNICMLLAEQKDEVWQHSYKKTLQEISYFFQYKLPIILPNDENFLSNDDKELNERSLLKRIVGAVFEYLEGLSWLRNTEFARHETCALFWILFNNKELAIVNKLQAGLLIEIQERIEENKEKGYPSLIRLLLDVYAFQFPSIPPTDLIGHCVQEEFYGAIAELALQSEKNAAYFLPPHWQWKLDEKNISTKSGKQIYPKTPIVNI